MASKVQIKPPSVIKDPRGGQDFVVGRNLGRGAFAVVYEARKPTGDGPPKDEELVALKIVKSHMPNKMVENKVVTVIYPKNP